ncbi:(+)-delta-cadinene synthase [Heracleum sosnowskyi]|uniref:(+)-delta-cadinene synthase n=1 Tax=Heracleum sosnowskyi TaxID=360622 RepID=A0AAD8HRS3_9APIA|nr:(+)-delta-cadinene synthase [Heracleum sosnowskyi]
MTTLNILATSASAKTVIPEHTRRSANYHPSVWGDKFLAYERSNQGKDDTDTVEQLQKLKEEVRKMLVLQTAEKPKQLINLIDIIQRLGISYHFQAEIEVLLQQMSNIFHELCASEVVDDLHDVALGFRLLRQARHKVSSTDVFRIFMDDNRKFKEYLLSDTRGLLSMYEATHFRVHDEEILEKALQFTTFNLENYLKSHMSNPLASEISHALKYPIRKNLNRLGVRQYISAEEKNDSHNRVLLKFAKLDFNQLQKMYQQELGHITRWWKDLNFAQKLPFARDRVVECYFWILGVYFEPQYCIARRFLTKVIMLASVVDDIYDLYGTFEELLLFTDAIERWDTRDLDLLPDYMKVCYQALLDTYSEMETVLDKEAGRPTYRVHEAKKSFTRLAKAYLDEAKWFKESYFPTTEEYMNVALVSAGYGTMATNSFVGMGDVATRKAFQWVSNDPLIVRASSLIARLCDDMTGHEFEQEKGDIPSAVECYMKQHGATKDEAYSELQKRVTNAWKDINQECLGPAQIPLSLLARIDNLTRAINILYDGDDGYTHSSTRTKDLIVSVLVDPVPF